MENTSEINALANLDVQRLDEIVTSGNDGKPSNRLQDVPQRLETDQNLLSGCSADNKRSNSVANCTLLNACEELPSSKYSYSDSDEDSLDFDVDAIDIPKIDESDMKIPINERKFHFMPDMPDLFANRSPLLKVNNVTYKFNFDPCDAYSKQANDMQLSSPASTRWGHRHPNISRR